MKVSLPSILIASCIALCLAGIAKGNLRIPGQNAIDSFRCFNLYLDFNHAHVEEDYLLMANVAKQIEKLSGNSQAREFSAYVAGYSTSAESHQRLKQDALHWAKAGALWLDESLAVRDVPYSGLQLAAYIYAERIVPNTSSAFSREQMLNNFETWMACGGGTSPVSPLTAQSYRDYLAVEPAGRDNYIMHLLQRDIAPE
ncbi:MAG: hypothetical protein H8E25_11075 [Planctomycetes bacterium]|nr:hypothetical protein [Planctomycetota bacterium]